MEEGVRNLSTSAKQYEDLIATVARCNILSDDSNRGALQSSCNFHQFTTEDSNQPVFWAERWEVRLFTICLRFSNAAARAMPV